MARATTSLLPAAAAAALLLLLIAPAAALPFRGPAFVGLGFCNSTVVEIPYNLPAEANCKCNCALTLRVTLPDAVCPLPGSERPFPVVVFYAGFLASNAAYQTYVTTLASWGYAVVQYDFAKPLLATVCSNDAAEAGYLPFILKRVGAAVADPASPLFNKLNLAKVGATGHSRGGKLAALVYAYGYVKGAFLIDPVDGFVFTANLPGYPSAVAALRGKNLPLGITGAEFPGPCNAPPLATGNYTNFLEVAGPVSWLEIVKGTGHAQFLELAKLGGVADKICCTKCSGLIPEAEAIALTTPVQVQWFANALLNVGVSIAFDDWLIKQFTAGKLTFQVKGPPPPGLTAAAATTSAAAAGFKTEAAAASKPLRATSSSSASSAAAQPKGAAAARPATAAAAATLAPAPNKRVAGAGR